MLNEYNKKELNSLANLLCKSKYAGDRHSAQRKEKGGKNYIAYF